MCISPEWVVLGYKTLFRGQLTCAYGGLFCLDLLVVDVSLVRVNFRKMNRDVALQEGMTSQPN